MSDKFVFFLLNEQENKFMYSSTSILGLKYSLTHALLSSHPLYTYLYSNLILNLYSISNSFVLYLRTDLKVKTKIFLKKLFFLAYRPSFHLLIYDEK